MKNVYRIYYYNAKENEYDDALFTATDVAEAISLLKQWLGNTYVLVTRVDNVY